MFDRPNLRLSIVLGASVAALIMTPTKAAANGGKSRSPYTLQADVTMERGKCKFTAQIDPLLFSLTTLAQKYHVVRIECKNDTRRDLKLSDEMDKAILLVGRNGEEVDAVIDLSRADPDAWESIPTELREKIVYPELVESGEEEDLLLFVPVQESKGAPERLLLQIDALDREVLLFDPNARIVGD